MIKLIIFDIGGVLINFTESMYAEYLSKKLNIPIRDVWDALLPLITAMEYGKMKVEDAKWMFADELDVAPDKLEWVEAYKKLAKPNTKVINLAIRLSKKYDTAILSDISSTRFREVLAMGVKRIKVKKFASFDIKMRKQDPNPHKRPFRYVLKAMGAKPEETVFIDDRLINVDHAKKVGIHTIQFKNYDQLVKELKEIDVL